MLNKKKVLVVDDDEMHLYTTKELLQNDRIQVNTHKNWLGVTNRIKELEPDLVLLDINMPGLSGNQLADIIKPYCDALKTPILFHSSNDEDSLRALARAHGAHGYICKGNVAELRSKVYLHLKLQA